MSQSDKSATVPLMHWDTLDLQHYVGALDSKNASIYAQAPSPPDTTSTSTGSSSSSTDTQQPNMRKKRLSSLQKIALALGGVVVAALAITGVAFLVIVALLSAGC